MNTFEKWWSEAGHKKILVLNKSIIVIKDILGAAWVAGHEEGYREGVHDTIQAQKDTEQELTYTYTISSTEGIKNGKT